MTSFRQIETNRRNASKSTGPNTEEGKQRSRCNAVRHGLTAETVIGTLEDAEDYEAFQAAIIADYDAQSAVERELVLRLASVFWRLRRAATMEAGLFELQAGQFRAYRQGQRTQPLSRKIIYAGFGRTVSADADLDQASLDTANGMEDLAKQSFGAKPVKFCMRSMPWIVANHKREGAVSVSIADKSCQSPAAVTIELPDADLHD